ncbi:MAG: hypothetical protein V7603_1587 [Micromonosporaceae bacterium]
MPAHLPLDGQGGPLTVPAATVDFWQRYHAGWHVLAGVGLGLVGVFAAVGGNLPTAHRTATVGLLVALLLWYAAVGVPAMKRARDRRGVGYFAGVLILLGGVYTMAPAAAFLLLILSPQIFAMIQRWRTRLVVLVLLFGEVAGAALVRRGFTAATLGQITVTALVPLVFAIMAGAYITGIIAQSRHRATLIDELTRTREDLAAQRHAAGVHAERERLAAEIHDTLAQGFTSILMLTQSARVLLDRSPCAVVAGSLDLIESTARENLAEARALVAALAPPDLADHTLADALIRLAERHTRDTGVPASVTVHGVTTGLAPETNVVLLRATQEALSNVGRHAAASEVRIELSYDAATAAVAVVDNGRGFDPRRISGGYGLKGLRSRAAAFGGTCSVWSRPGAGTTVRVELPRLGRAAAVQS